jgi:nucleotide-binding universal stress UspA family protein
MSESIVVGTDGSDTAKRAVKEAARLAKALGADIHIVSAFAPLRDTTIAGGPPGAGRIWGPVPDANVEITVDEAAAAIRVSGVNVETHRVQKDPADALLDVAADIGASLIVVGNQGMHSAKGFVFGSVPNKVSHKARCNVLIVSTDKP